MLADQIWRLFGDAGKIVEFPRDGRHFEHLWADLTHVGLRDDAFPSEVGLVTDVSVRLGRSSVELVDRETHLVGESSDAFLHMLDIFAMKALEAWIVLVEYPTQTIKIVAGGADVVRRAIKTGR